MPQGTGSSSSAAGMKAPAPQGTGTPRLAVGDNHVRNCTELYRLDIVKPSQRPSGSVCLVPSCGLCKQKRRFFQRIRLNLIPSTDEPV